MPPSALTNKDPLQVNQYVCVQTDEIFLTNNVSRWLRAKVTKTHPLTEVYLIDIGKYLFCSPEKILDELPQFYHSQKPNAKKCRLKNANPKSNNQWSTEGIKYFKTLMNDDNLSVTYVERYQASENCIDDQYTIEVFNKNR